MVFFPYEKVRPIQSELMADVEAAIRRRGHLIANAPTGLGKTIASLGPALQHAKESGKTVFFLTSRHTQHKIAIDTVRLIKEKFGPDITAVDIISRQAMCPVAGTQTLYSREFAEYCRKMREDGKCEFYAESRKKNGGLAPRAKKMVEEMMPILPMHVEKLKGLAGEEGLCPYEISVAMSKKALCIVCDYFYLFSPSIRDVFLSKIGKSIEDIIVIIDEGHNLPARLRELMSERLTSWMVSRAKKEARRYGFDEAEEAIEKIGSTLEMLKGGLEKNSQKVIARKDLVLPVSRAMPYEDLYEMLQERGDDVRAEQKQSSIASIGDFLESWLGADDGFVRFVSRADDAKRQFVSVEYKCLDPSLVSSDVMHGAYSVIMMSGTLTPTEMYRDLLGFPKGTVEKEYPSPFPDENRMTFVVPGVTTKYSERSDSQYQRIAKACADITDKVPGNSIVFFPSYFLLERIGSIFEQISRKTILREYSGMSKEEKEAMMDKFREYKKTGAVLLACASGSFGEGVDFPDDELKAVLVVGLPLQPPDLETKELIAYYDKKFGKGWDYGYTLPAITKTLQNAGRCIRSATDKGVIAFLDNRYLFSNYKRCFPKDWSMRIVQDPEKEIGRFFGKD